MELTPDVSHSRGQSRPDGVHRIIGHCETVDTMETRAEIFGSPRRLAGSKGCSPRGQLQLPASYGDVGNRAPARAMRGPGVTTSAKVMGAVWRESETPRKRDTEAINKLRQTEIFGSDRRQLHPSCRPRLPLTVARSGQQEIFKTARRIQASAERPPQDSVQGGALISAVKPWLCLQEPSGRLRGSGITPSEEVFGAVFKTGAFGEDVCRRAIFGTSRPLSPVSADTGGGLARRQAGSTADLGEDLNQRRLRRASSSPPDSMSGPVSVSCAAPWPYGADAADEIHRMKSCSVAPVNQLQSGMASSNGFELGTGEVGHLEIFGSPRQLRTQCLSVNPRARHRGLSSDEVDIGGNELFGTVRCLRRAASRPPPKALTVQNIFSQEANCGAPPTLMADSTNTDTLLTIAENASIVNTPDVIAKPENGEVHACQESAHQDSCLEKYIPGPVLPDSRTNTYCAQEKRLGALYSEPRTRAPPAYLGGGTCYAMGSRAPPPRGRLTATAPQRRTGDAATFTFTKQQEGGDQSWKHLVSALQKQKLEPSELKVLDEFEGDAQASMCELREKYEAMRHAEEELSEQHLAVEQTRPTPELLAIRASEKSLAQQGRYAEAARVRDKAVNLEKEIQARRQAERQRKLARRKESLLKEETKEVANLESRLCQQLWAHHLNGEIPVPALTVN